MTKPNIIFIVLDTLREDRVFKRYNNCLLTPFMEELTKSSFFFKNCIANSPWTLPSHNSMFTGLYPTQNTILSGEVDRINKNVPTISEILKEVGYNTIAYSENPWISKSFGLIKGFDEYFKNFYSKTNIKDPKISTKQTRFTTYTKIINDLISYFLKKIDLKIGKLLLNQIKFWINKLLKRIFWKEIVNRVYLSKRDTLICLKKLFDFIEKHPKKPLFLFINLMTVHDPYIPLFRKVNQNFEFSLGDLKKLSNFITSTRINKLKVNLKKNSLTPEIVDIFNKFYNSTVISCDYILKTIFLRLNKLNIIDNSYLLITSDHGEHLGSVEDHYLWEHNTHQSVYEQLIKVPLFIYNQNFDKKVINNQVQIKDIFHTILHLTGTSNKKHPSYYPKKSILYQVKNNTFPKYILGEYLKSKNEMIDLIKKYGRHIKKDLYPKILNHLYFLRSNSEKYIYYEGTDIEEYYDLKMDPYEQNNLFELDNSGSIIKSKLDEKLNNIKDRDFLKQIITKKEKQNLKEVIKFLKL